MKRYEGRRTDYGAFVTVNGLALDLRLDLYNHSPTGFEWGYGGSGPAQVALAILADHLGNDDEAMSLYQDFKHAVVAGLPKRGWTLTSRDIDQALQRIQQAGGAS